MLKKAVCTVAAGMMLLGATPVKCEEASLFDWWTFKLESKQGHLPRDCEAMVWVEGVGWLMPEEVFSIGEGKVGFWARDGRAVMIYITRGRGR